MLYKHNEYNTMYSIPYYFLGDCASNQGPAWITAEASWYSGDKNSGGKTWHPPAGKIIYIYIYIYVCKCVYIVQIMPK